jgi:glycosyltransferase involved in cell wall biosynthesis
VRDVPGGAIATTTSWPARSSASAIADADVPRTAFPSNGVGVTAPRVGKHAFVRVLLIIDSLSVGGAERHLVDLARRLRDRGDTVVVACSTGGPGADELEAAGVPVEVLCRRLVKRRLSVAWAWRIRRLVSTFDPDVVHAHLHAATWAAALALVGSRRPLVMTDQTEGPWRGPLAGAISTWAYARADRVIAVSEAIAHRLGDYGVPREKISVVRNTVVPGRPVERAARGRTVGVIARLVPEKGIEDFLDAMAGLRGEDGTTRAVIVGDGPLRGALEGRCASLGLDGAVTFWGERRDARSLLQEFDVLAVPSRAEGTPLTILEAMWAGVPLVATTAGGIPEQIRDGREALLVSPGDVAGLRAALRRVLDDHALAGRLAANARRRAATAFSPDRMVDAIVAVYGGEEQSLVSAPPAVAGELHPEPV